jgi:uncharacterized protein YeaO (DUF488 family)
MATGQIALKRAYEPAAASDGWRVLVERLWPRGISKSRLALDGWPKELAPSAKLRQWYDHDANKRAEFARLYRAELRAPIAQAALAELRSRATPGPVTLLFATHDVALSSATILRDVLLAGTQRAQPKSSRARPKATRPRSS